MYKVNGEILNISMWNLESKSQTAPLTRTMEPIEEVHFLINSYQRQPLNRQHHL